MRAGRPTQRLLRLNHTGGHQQLLQISPCHTDICPFTNKETGSLISLAHMSLLSMPPALLKQHALPSQSFPPCPFLRSLVQRLADGKNSKCQV